MTERRTSQLRHDLDDLHEIVGDIRTTVDGHTSTLAGTLSILRRD
ncbi:hypothetical protein [Aeromicrobium sp. CTD01-1L150]